MSRAGFSGSMTEDRYENNYLVMSMCECKLSFVRVLIGF